MWSRRAVVFALAALPLSAWAGQRAGRKFSGENPLGVPRPEFATAQDGMELIYLRRYEDALEVFEEAGVNFPESPLGPVGRSIVYQAMMFENYDFAHDAAWKSEHAEAQTRIKGARRQNDRKYWNQFLEAVHLGVVAMYGIRQGDYLGAFNQAWDALELVRKVQRAVPTFHDLQLALGLYNYWRTAISEQVDGLPSFGDHREEGLEQMRTAKAKGLLAPAPASLCLTYSYLEGKRWKDAIAEAQWARERYPQNILNETTLGRVFMAAQRFDDALRTFEGVRTLAPENTRIWWHIGEAHFKARRDNASARKAYDRYLESKPIDEYRAYAYYRIGLLARRQRDYEEAERWLLKCTQTWPKFKEAAKKLEEVRARKEGTD